MKIKAAIFDMDGTLVDSLMIWNVLWSNLGEKYLSNPNFSPSAKDDQAVRTLTLKDAMELIHINYDMAQSGAELLDVATNIMIEFYSSSVKLKPGVLRFLDHLYQSGTNMCILSATALDLIGVAVEHCNISKYFSNIISCAAFGYGKENPEVFKYAQNLLNTPNEEIWVFEDSLTAVKTAKSIGMNTVGIFDKNNYGQEELKTISNVYIDDGESLVKLIN